MASETVSRTLGTPYFNLTCALQGFYAARGMWVNGKPQGALAAMLGDMAPFGSSSGLVFYMTPEQIGELMRDIAENGHRGMNHWQVAQALRRLRESLKRSGSPDACQLNMPIQRQQPRSNAHCTLRPFEPLVVPAGGRARKAFEKHVMDCVRAVVDFSQESIYMQEPGHQAGA